MKLQAKHTIAACFTGAMVQAIVLNFPPLLYITFEHEFGISLSKISLLIAVSFITQLLMDFTASKIPVLFNNRATVVLGQALSAIGLVSMALLPSVMPVFPALIIATAVAALGSGIIEVMGNPIIDACPIKNKHKILSFLHSGYCWGLVLTVLLSTLFFVIAGTEHWRTLSILWALIPALNAIAFIFVPIFKVNTSPNENDKHHAVFHTFTFWALFAIMLCAGAAEQVMSQWASSFAEEGLGVSKTVGDLLGPCAFALLMGTARIIYAQKSEKINLTRFMTVSSVLCIIAFLLAALAPHPLLSLAGCALCGFSVGIMWPGTLCMATGYIPGGGVKMFALLALAGDIGCTLGPTVAGWIAEAAGNDLKISFIFSIIFPFTMIILLAALSVKKIKANKSRKDMTNGTL